MSAQLTPSLNRESVYGYPLIQMNQEVWDLLKSNVIFHVVILQCVINYKVHCKEN